MSFPQITKLIVFNLHYLPWL